MERKLFFMMVLAVAGAVLAGCSKETDLAILERKLVGSWEWVGTAGGFAFHIHQTPANTGMNVELRIGAAGKYQIYTNGVLTKEGSYSFDTGKCIHDHSEKPVLQLSGGGGGMIDRLTDGKLDLSDEAYDGLGSSYERRP